MGNGQLKAAYNVQAGTENQYVVFTSVHQRPGDTACAVPHLERAKEALGHVPDRVVADAGYGSEENYEWLRREGAAAYVKHADFFRECRNRGWREDPMRPANWPYDPEADSFACPEGRRLAFVRASVRKTGTGYEQVVCTYRCADCSGCPRRDACFGDKDPAARRTLTVAPSRPSTGGGRAPCFAPRRARGSARGARSTSRPSSATSSGTSASRGSRCGVSGRSSTSGGWSRRATTYGRWPAHGSGRDGARPLPLALPEAPAATGNGGGPPRGIGTGRLHGAAIRTTSDTAPLFGDGFHEGPQGSRVPFAVRFGSYVNQINSNPLNW